jgi:hypothetical protein
MNENKHRCCDLCYLMGRKNRQAWISVKTRLPDNEREVFITDGLTVSAARYYQYGGWGVTLGRGNKYWMEKPELPEEK